MSTIPDLEAFFAKLSPAELQKLNGTLRPSCGRDASERARVGQRRPEQDATSGYSSVALRPAVPPPGDVS